jgi:hypothetical protein
MIRYELWAGGKLLATYQTLGQALLGALWRSKKLKRYVYTHKTNKKTSSQCVAAVTAYAEYPKF